MTTMKKVRVLHASQCDHVQAEWGNLTWFASAGLGNSEDITVGRCVIKSGRENPMHSHPNCSEVLVVFQGTIMHTIEDGKEAELNPGDTISIPPNMPHMAKNISDVDAVLFIAFSSANRELKGE
jgi:quercetin dioxygenase-like cupin family protein